MVVSEELRSLSWDDRASSGTDDETDVVVVVERGDGCRFLAGVGAGGMRIRDGESMKLPAAGDESLKQGT